MWYHPEPSEEQEANKTVNGQQPSNPLARASKFNPRMGAIGKISRCMQCPSVFGNPELLMRHLVVEHNHALEPMTKYISNFVANLSCPATVTTAKQRPEPALPPPPSMPKIPSIALRCCSCPKSFSTFQEPLKHHKEPHVVKSPMLQPTRSESKTVIQDSVNLSVIPMDKNKVVIVGHAYVCPNCQEAFQDSTQLRQHMLLHHGVVANSVDVGEILYRQYQCLNCNMTFATQTGFMNHHIANHYVKVSDKPEEIIEKTTDNPVVSLENKKPRLVKPIEIKKSERRFKCKTCWKTFRTHDKAKDHVKAAHPDLAKTYKSSIRLYYKKTKPVDSNNNKDKIAKETLALPIKVKDEIIEVKKEEPERNGE